MSQDVFINRILNLKKIKVIGLDMDHTLIRYKTEHFEALVFELVVEALIKTKQYPEQIRQFKFNMQDAIRGLVIDSEHGNILKLNRYAAIRQSYHGTKPIDFKTQQRFYGSTYIDLNNSNYRVIDTSFSIAFCVLYRQLVDLKDADEGALPNYRMIADDVLMVVDEVHADGSLKQKIAKNLSHFVIKDAGLVEAMARFIRYGKKILIITNSEYTYTKILLDYAINPFLPKGQTWENFFEYVIAQSVKPRFFYDTLRFLSIDTKTGAMSNLTGPLLPGVYQGGNAVQLTDALGLGGDEILYIGDHIYGDLLRLKKACNWRTALVVEELGTEIKAQKKAAEVEKNIFEQMKKKRTLEKQHVKLLTSRLDEKTDKYDDKIREIQDKINVLDTHISELLTEERQFYNATWGQVFRAGAEESYFAQQVDRYACIYMEKLIDLFACSPLTYFRADRRVLPHDVAYPSV
ncbi:MAG: HAD-IG family 5'-nucleotidase [Gammaproteobacteria bacterium]|nr:HAD-IG family 5'-nucleotidase [Gammaproteobacteria bacterium]